MGKMSIFSCFYANLITKGKEHGFHVFIVQLRDENHRPMPGVEVFEVGPKIGDNGTETGGLRLTNVRIPRAWMLCKNQVVHPDGTYEKSQKTQNSKMQYSTMLTIRTGLVMGAGYRLAQGVTIAARYSCVRRQGFEDTSSTSRDAPELQIIEYQNQQYRLFTQLSKAYAFIWTGKVVADRFNKVLEALQGADPDGSELPEMHAISSGLKALCTFEGAQGLEECRKLCGGHGVLLVAGVGQIALDYTTYVTAEGDKIVLELQSARYLMRQLTQAREGKPISGLCAYLKPCKDRRYDPSPELATSASTPSAFLDLGLLERLFRGRALNYVVSTGDRLEEELRRNNNNMDKAWNACAIDLAICSRVHCYYMMLVNFMAVVQPGSGRLDCEKTREAMANLCRFYALQNMCEDFGSFSLTRAQQAAAKEALRSLFPLIRHDIIALTDAFEFPDNVLNSALGE
jgi:acyl-CoA oxidase